MLMLMPLVWTSVYKLRTDDQVFLDKFYLLLCMTQIDKFFLVKELCSKAGYATFGQSSFSRENFPKQIKLVKEGKTCQGHSLYYTVIAVHAVVHTREQLKLVKKNRWKNFVHRTHKQGKLSRNLTSKIWSFVWGLNCDSAQPSSSQQVLSVSRRARVWTRWENRIVLAVLKHFGGNKASLRYQNLSIKHVWPARLGLAYVPL